LLAACILFDSLFNLEDGGDTSFRNIDGIVPNYTVLPRKIVLFIFTAVRTSDPANMLFTILVVVSALFTGTVKELARDFWTRGTVESNAV
jgi:hypothetical protein